jgi:hypothetical protein
MGDVRRRAGGAVIYFWLSVVFCVGVAIGRFFASSPERRCEKLREYTLTNQLRGTLLTTKMAVRCRLDQGHSGPHCVRLLEGQPNERGDWFED